MNDLRKAVEGIMAFRAHRAGCSYFMSEFCDCGLKEAADAVRAALVGAGQQEAPSDDWVEGFRRAFEIRRGVRLDPWFIRECVNHAAQYARGDHTLSPEPHSDHCPAREDATAPCRCGARQRNARPQPPEERK